MRKPVRGKPRIQNAPFCSDLGDTPCCGGSEVQGNFVQGLFFPLVGYCIDPQNPAFQSECTSDNGFQIDTDTLGFCGVFPPPSVSSKLTVRFRIIR
jgi:hypothetical protein